MNNETLKCKDCGITFESSTELELKTKSCPKCIEKSQDEMLRFMFGEPDKKSVDER
jgi:predicted Zn-ribbon and HTH transcriptional regulator